MWFNSKNFMRKVLPIFVLIIVALTAKSQIRPSDSLYLWVDFREDKILISIPEQYINYRTQCPELPKHVRVNEVLMLVPNLPEKGTLLSILAEDLHSYNNSSDKDDQLKFLGQLVLLLFYSNNDLSIVPDDAMKKLNDLNNNSAVRNEAAMVVKWVGMIKK